MSDFKLPDLGSLPDLDELESKPLHSKIDDEPLGLKDAQEDSLIDLEDEDNYEEESSDNESISYYEEEEEEEEYEDELESGELEGTVIDVKLNMENEITVVKLETDTKGIVYLKIPYIEELVEKGKRISAQYEEEQNSATKTGIPIFIGYGIVVLDSRPIWKKEKKDPRSSDRPKTKKSFFDKLKSAANEVKGELNGNKDDTNDYEDEENEDLKETNREKENERPKNEKRQGKKKSPIITLYLAIADLIYSFIMGVINFLSKIPLLGRLLGILKFLDPVIKFLSRLWLLFVILFIWVGTSLFTNLIDKSQNENVIPESSEVLKKDNISIIVKSKELKGDMITVDLQNSSEIYADFYLTATIKEKSFIPFLGKKSECIGQVIVLGIEEEKPGTLKCDAKFDKAKIKNLDINIDN